MKKFLFSALLLAGAVVAPPAEAANYGFVNFKEIIEQSKMGKQEQAMFDALKTQMEKVLEEKDKELNELASKFNDPDYMDSLSPDAENELKHKLRSLSQDMSEKQNQFYQALQNAQAKIMNKLAESISKAAAKVAKEKQLDAVFNQDASFWVTDSANLSAAVVKTMDDEFSAETNKKAE
jgi:outer membrane protein